MYDAKDSFRLQPLEPRLLLSASPDGGLMDPAPQASAASVCTRQAEDLDRGVVAIRQSGSQVYVSWRLLGLDPADIGFNLYRSSEGGGTVKLNAGVITLTTDFVDTTATQGQAYEYYVRPVISGVEGDASHSFTTAPTGALPYLSVPLQVPPDGTTPDGLSFSYTANDASVGDVDGDGQYEIILKWDPTNSKDNSQSGYTGNVFVDAYELDGTQLWRINLGHNIRAGAHYTQFAVYDLDGDGRAEVSMKTAPGTIDGQGNPVLMGGDFIADDYRNGSGYIITGPEYYTVFDGYSGAQLDTVALEPARGSASQWGDNYGNRVDRFLTGIAYLDGVQPSVIFSRGYYRPQSGFNARNEIVAYDFRNGQLSTRWHFQAATNGQNPDYIGQGAHSLTVGDVDGDGFDEVVYGGAVIDDDGTGHYSMGLGTGDALHLSDMDPSRPGLEVFMVHESPSEFNTGGVNAGGELRDADTGQLLVTIPASNDVGRGVAFDVDPNHAGYEFWGTANNPNGDPRMIYNVNGQAIYPTPSGTPVNFGVWWDADPLREMLDGTRISELQYNQPNPAWQTLVSASSGGAVSNNSTKATPALSGDILGDWREEVIWRNNDSSELQIWTTTIPATSRMYTLMHDMHYRMSIAAQNSAYNQPPHTGFFLGDGMATPPTPNVSYTAFTGQLTETTHPGALQAEHSIYSGVGTEPANNHAGFNGTGFVNFGADGGYIQFENIDGFNGGTRNIQIRYALGTADRTGRLVVNGVGQDITFASTTDWDNWTILEATVNLELGAYNVIRFESNGDDLANIDQLTISPPLIGDLDGDGFVGIIDLSTVLESWNSPVSEGYPADPSGDGFVGIEDLNVVLGNWNAGTPPVAEPVLAEQDSVTDIANEEASSTVSLNMTSSSTSSLPKPSSEDRASRERQYAQPISMDKVSGRVDCEVDANHATFSDVFLAAHKLATYQQGLNFPTLNPHLLYTPSALNTDEPAGLLNLWEESED